MHPHYPQGRFVATEEHCLGATANGNHGKDNCSYVGATVRPVATTVTSELPSMVNRWSAVIVGARRFSGRKFIGIVGVRTTAFSFCGSHERYCKYTTFVAKKLRHVQFCLAPNRDWAPVGAVFLAQSALNDSFSGTTAIFGHLLEMLLGGTRRKGVKSNRKSVSSLKPDSTRSLLLLNI